MPQTTPPARPMRSGHPEESYDSCSGLQGRAEACRRIAQAAAKRLIDARPATGPRPATEEELMSMIESMARTPRLWGVVLLPYEKRAIKKWHAFRRALTPKTLVE